MKSSNRCAHCRQILIPNPRVKNQEYCDRQMCQKARKAKWQRQKMASDSDYRLNQKDAQDQWREVHPDYWDKYRQSHPEYCERNRQLQKLRDAKRRAVRLAKMDALNQLKPVNPGTYYLVPLAPNLAKMDALAQRISIIPVSYKHHSPSCKKGLDRQSQRFGIEPDEKEVQYDHQSPSRSG